MTKAPSPFDIPKVPPAPSARFYLPIELVEGIQAAIGVAVMESLVATGVLVRNDNADRVTREERREMLGARKIVSPHYENIAKKLEEAEGPMKASAVILLGIFHVTQFLHRDILYLLQWGDNPFSASAIVRQYFELAMATHCWALDPDDIIEVSKKKKIRKRPRAFEEKTSDNIKKGFPDEEWLKAGLGHEYRLLSEVAHSSVSAINTAWKTEREGEDMISVSPNSGWDKADFTFVMECFHISSILLTNGIWKLTKYFTGDADWEANAVEIFPVSREEYLDQLGLSPDDIPN